jgi:formylglycine-generating enzyme required for sulfatase activity
MLTVAPALAHPGSGIVVDHRGYVWFLDTGYGLWQIDPAGRLTAQAGPAGHFLAIDRKQSFNHRHFANLEPGDVEVARIDPTLIVARSYPVTVGVDCAFYFPQVSGKGRVRIMRMAAGEAAKPFADLPQAREIGYEGKEVNAEWVWGLAAGPDGALYYTQQRSLHRVAPDGTVTTVADKITVPDCERPEGLKNAHSETNLYGLDVAADGTVYVAAPGCSAVLRIAPDGVVSVVLRATDRWSPQGVAVVGEKLYVLEYDYVASEDRADWYPRVRRLDPDGTATILAQVDERPERADAGVRALPRQLLADVTKPARAHAAIVHFPIVLFIVSVPAAVWAVVARNRWTPRLQVLALFVVLFVLCSVSEWTGELAERQVPYGTDGVPGAAWESLRQHTTYAGKLKQFAGVGTIAAIVALLPLKWRFAGALRLGAMLLALGAGLGGSAVAVVTGHYGGELVYGQGLGSQTLHRYLEEKYRTNKAATQLASMQMPQAPAESPVADFAGSKAGEQRRVAGTALCWCPPGRFDMGSPRSELERRPFESQVSVTLTRGLWMGAHEVTQGDWKRIAGKLPGELTAELPAGDDLPVGNVSFSEAESYCHKLTEVARASGELPAGWEFRLPTEAQWEYACRAGTTTATSFGKSIGSKQANIKGDKPYNGGEPGPTLGRAAKVGSYPANPWGLHDMHGNTCEWCRDWFHWRYSGVVDPDLYDAQSTATKNDTGDYSRSRRGSCWADDAWASRSAFRQRFEPHRRYDHIGFRVALVRK